jgi:carbon monoxide dehydrogenase subunit G
VATVRRAREVAATADEVWDVVSDPHHLPRWWPGVQRVEEASPEAWTKVLRTEKGKAVRADYTRVEADPPRRLVWQQEVEESPFERILSAAVTEVSLEPVGAGHTRVHLKLTQRLRGLYRFGSPSVRRAARAQLDEALDGLERAFG